MKMNDVYGNEISITPGSHACFNGTWLSITKMASDESGKDNEVSPPCALTPGQLKLLAAAIEERLENIALED
jgi:hypothetical protein